VSTFQSRFEDWRKVDLKATAQLQQHVKSLQKLNDSVGDFLARCSAIETFQDFHGTMATLSEEISGLRSFRDDFMSNVERTSDVVARRVLDSLRSQDEERHAWLYKTLEEQGQVQESMIITQRKLLNRLDTIGFAIDQQTKTSAAQKEQLARVDAVQSAIQQDCQCLVDLQQNVFKSFRNSSEQQESLQDNIFGKISSGMEDLGNYLVNSLGWNSEMPSLTQAFTTLEARLTEWEAKSLQDAMDLRLEVSRLEGALRESEGELGRNQQAKEESLTRQTALSEEVDMLKSSLDDKSSQLQTAELASMLNSMKRIREIETRGNVKLDRQFGRVALAQPLVFAPAAPAKDAKQCPAVSFADPSEAESLLEDVYDVVSMFGAPLNINVSCKVAKGGDNAIWQEMATKRAQAIKDYLVDSGFPEEKIQVGGFVGANEIHILLVDTSIFPPKPAASKARGRSASPR